MPWSRVRVPVRELAAARRGEGGAWKRLRHRTWPWTWTRHTHPPVPSPHVQQRLRMRRAHQGGWDASIDCGRCPEDVTTGRWTPVHLWLRLYQARFE